MNKEYRSISRELGTSEEELQSINSELRLKLAAISRAHSDLQALIAATDVGMLFLDSQLRIKRFTDGITSLFTIAPSDAGRPVTDFAPLLEYGDLAKDARIVLTHQAPIRREVRSQNGRWYDLHLRPYRALDDRIDGVVITLVEISEPRQVEEARRVNEQLLRQERTLVDLAPDPIFIWDLDGGIVEWNRGSEELYGFSRAEALGKRTERLLSTTIEGSSFAEFRENLLREGSWRGELQHRTKDRRELTVESRIVLETIGGRRLALESTRDITGRKDWEQRQRLLLGELTHRVKNTLTVVQAIARQTLRRRGGASLEDMVERLEGRLLALARSHSLVAADWKGADFDALARQQLEPYGADNPSRIYLKGPPATLPPDIATPFGLVLHELATNAAKYGSLSQPKGSVNLRWKLAKRNSRAILSVVWQEKGGPPPPKKPNPSGFGTSLIHRGIPNTRVRRDLRPEGLICRIELTLPGQQNAEPTAGRQG